MGAAANGDSRAQTPNHLAIPQRWIFSCLTLSFLLFCSPQEQYEFCYKVVQEYIDAFSDYANFK